jgi:hypothetical protein
MAIKCNRVRWIGAGCFLATQAFAQSVLVHVQGETGSREAYFADFFVVMNRTPMDRILGPIQVRELDTTIVYESADKPELSSLRLQFECVAKHAYDGTTIPEQPAFDAPVKVRIGENSWKLRRDDLKSENLPAGEWRTSASPVLLKLHKIACNDDVMRSAVIKTAKNNQDMGIFIKEMAAIGLPEDLQLIPHQTAADYLDFAWWVLWSGAQRPDPSGKWSSRPTKQQLAEYKEKISQIQKQYDQLAAGIAPQLEENIKQMDAEFSFQKIAAGIRGGRSLSRNETHMLAVWEGKTETDIGAKMGAPLVTDAGELRFLSYGQEFDNRVVVGNNKGAVWEEGLYENCNVQYVMHQDDKNIFRVADVRIWTDSNQIGQVVFACDGLLDVPN